jgi:toxic protein SymE
MEASSNNTLTNPEVRNLKVYPKNRVNRWSRVTVPEIRLCGNWLEELGFSINSRVIVTTSPGMLILRSDDDCADLPY